MSRQPLLRALGILTLLTLFVTWPQGRFLASGTAEHQDPLLSAWRLGWIAHALKTDPTHLYDANIFHPERRTLAYSDATLLQGALGAPLFWAHLPAIAIYNVMLLAGFISSGLGLFVLARHLTGNERAALVGAAIFAIAPLRIDHFMHLELQWAAWIPLTFWALHRVVDDGSWRFGALAGVLVALQVFSCVYYGVFLAIASVVLVALLFAVKPGCVRAAAPALALGAVLAIAITVPYARPYIENARALGARDVHEVALYSARPINYLAAVPQNWLWGWTARRFGGPEAHLFAGVVALLLGALAFARRPRTIVWIYAAVCASAIELSFGFNGRLYPWIYAHVWLLDGLRAPARFAIVVYCAFAVIAAFGFAELERRFTRRVRRPALLCTLVIGLLAVEYGSAPMRLMRIPRRSPDVYRFVQTLDPGVIVELPMPLPWRLPGQDPQYMFWSTVHWKPLVNGYSGHVSLAYVETVQQMLTFPDEASIQRLRELQVRYILIHKDQYDAKPYAALMVAVFQRRDLSFGGTFHDWTNGDTHVFELKP